jgi:hypothetical protein
VAGGERMLLQGRFAGHLLDDITVLGTDHFGHQREIEYQSNRTTAPLASDKEFIETIQRCVQFRLTSSHLVCHESLPA